jgi:hypothetical protein
MFDLQQQAIEPAGEMPTAVRIYWPLGRRDGLQG